jgi:hypothetical protein
VSDRLWHYLELSNGRFYCPEHGGFCDASDNFQPKCLVCESSDSAKMNPIQRSLRLINGLQDRSKRNAAFSGSDLGGFSILSLANLASTDNMPLNHDLWNYFSFVVPIITLSVSTGLFASSMGHIGVSQNGRIGRKSIDQWEEKLQRHLAKMEWHHQLGNWFFGASIALFICALVAQPL